MAVYASLQGEARGYLPVYRKHNEASNLVMRQAKTPDTFLTVTYSPKRLEDVFLEVREDGPDTAAPPGCAFQAKDACTFRYILSRDPCGLMPMV